MFKMQHLVAGHLLNLANDDFIASTLNMGRWPIPSDENSSLHQGISDPISIDKLSVGDVDCVLRLSESAKHSMARKPRPRGHH